MTFTREIARTNADFMSRVYLWMMIGLALSGFVAFTISNDPVLIGKLMSSSMLWIGLIILQIGAVVVLSAMINRLSTGVATMLYLGYAALSGVTFSVVFLAFTQSSIFEAFFITAFAFTGLSIFGFVTKRNLGPVGSFCMIGLFGLIGFILVTMLFPSIKTTSVSMTINVLAILIFAGLTAYDTQRIKNMNVGGGAMQKAVISGALMLYLDFINLFLNILNLFGERR